MNNYWRMMEQVTLSDQKKEEIMDMLENKRPQKRRMPKAANLVLAAALAAGCVLSIAAGLPAQVYNFVIGGSVTYMPGSGHAVFSPGTDEPVTSEDGRLWLTIGGERRDITDLVDETTPYIYENMDEKTGNKGYLIVGGTAERFGWVEFSVMDGCVGALTGLNYSDEFVTLPDGSEVPFFDLTDEQREQFLDENGGITGRYADRPWFQAALDQLGFEY